MSSYSNSGSWVEWSKWAVFKLGNIFGFPQPTLAAIVGSVILFLTWALLPGSFVLALKLPVFGPKFPEIGLTYNVLRFSNWAALGFGSMMGVACWCRVAVLCHPKVFDRYKIRGVPL